MLRVGDLVEKIEGYRWPGYVVAVFTNTFDEPRVVVECSAEDCLGALHIYRPDQLRKVGE